MKELYKYFPKEIGVPSRKYCGTPEKFFDEFRKANGTWNKVYFSLYDCIQNKVNKENSYDFCKLHMVSFDIDNGKKLENTRKIHKILLDMNIRHCIIFSTSGFWVHLLTKNYDDIKFTKDCLTNAHDHWANVFDMKWGKAKDEDVDLDIAIRGDHKRISRMLGSYDIRRNRYCISITSQDLDAGYEHIVKKSENKPNMEINWYGTEYFDIKQCDYRIISRSSSSIFDDTNFLYIPEEEKSYINDSEIPKVLQYFMPLVNKWLMKDGGAEWELRYYATLYFVELGLPDEMIDKLAMKFFYHTRTEGPRTNYHHWKLTKVLQQAKRENANFPRIETLYEKGLIKGACFEDYVKYNELYNRYYDLDMIKFKFDKKKEEIATNNSIGKEVSQPLF